MGSAMLHILNQPTHSEPAEQMLLTVAEGDSILLIEDAVQALLHVNWRGWHLENDIRVFILEEDAISRGVYPVSSVPQDRWLDMRGFVALTEQHTKILSWY